MSVQLHKSVQSLELSNGSVLDSYELAYTTYGNLNNSGDNVIWIMHAFSANSDPKEWWPGMVGEGLYFDPAKYFIICVNMLGSCYGSTGPGSVNPKSGNTYADDFPLCTNRDIVTAFDRLREQLGVKKIKFCIGASLGAQQMLEWAIMKPELFEIICPVSTNAKFSAWGIAYNEAQRMALETDSTLWSSEPDAGRKGIQTARAIAMMSYRTYHTYHETQTDDDGRIDNFSASSYQRYQGLKLANRFSAQTYWYLSKMMDAHNVGKGRGGVEEALSMIQAKAYVIGVSSDNLFPKEEQQYLAEHIPNSEYIEIDSIYGHDGFLVEFDQLTKIMSRILD